MSILSAGQPHHPFTLFYFASPGVAGRETDKIGVEPEAKDVLHGEEPGLPGHWVRMGQHQGGFIDAVHFVGQDAVAGKEHIDAVSRRLFRTEADGR
jgi:hypothetical protein